MEISAASKTHSIAGPRRTDLWRSQPDPAWNQPCEANGLVRFECPPTLDARRRCLRDEASERKGL